MEWGKGIRREREGKRVVEGRDRERGDKERGEKKRNKRKWKKKEKEKKKAGGE